MKRVLCLLTVCLLYVSVMAQPSVVKVATDKTTSLVFPFPVRHVDRGSKDVLVQQVKEADHILLVKAAIQNFPETNLSVVTSDGSVYSFVILHSEQQEVPVYYITPVKDDNVTTYANSILDNPRTIRGIRDQRWDMEVKINGIYIRDQVIYYQLLLHNRSPIDYDIDLLRFYIRDKKKSKRTAVQENEIIPLYLAGNTRQVKAGQTSMVVAALDKFTIPDAKYLAIQILEKNGGRHLHLKVNNNKIIRAIPLSSLH